MPDKGVLVLTLRDLSAADGDQDGQLARRLTRLSLEGDLAMPFRLYFDQTRVDGAHRYALDARVIADGGTLFALPAPRRVLNADGDRQGVTLPLSPTSANAGLVNTYWRLVRVGDRAAPPPADQAAQAHLVLHRDGGRLKGATGCNRLQGQYQTEGNGLTLSNLTRTEKACTGDNVADDFVAALEKPAATGYRASSSPCWTTRTSHWRCCGRNTCTDPARRRPMRVHYLSHVPFEKLGTLAEWFDAHGHPVNASRLYQGDPLPAPEDLDALVVMGGPMGADDEARYPGWPTRSG